MRLSHGNSTFTILRKVKQPNRDENAQDEENTGRMQCDASYVFRTIIINTE